MEFHQLDWWQLLHQSRLTAIANIQESSTTATEDYNWKGTVQHNCSIYTKNLIKFWNWPDQQFLGYKNQILQQTMSRTSDPIRWPLVSCSIKFTGFFTSLPPSPAEDHPGEGISNGILCSFSVVNFKEIWLQGQAPPHQSAATVPESCKPLECSVVRLDDKLLPQQINWKGLYSKLDSQALLLNSGELLLPQ